MKPDEQHYFSANPDAERFSCTSLDEAVHERLDDLDPENWPAKLRVDEYEPQKLDVEQEASWTLRSAIERLEDEYGGTDDDYVPTERLSQAALEFAKVLAEEYRVFRCDFVKRHEVDVLAWVKEHRPWPDTDAALARCPSPRATSR